MPSQTLVTGLIVVSELGQDRMLLAQGLQVVVEIGQPLNTHTTYNFAGGFTQRDAPVTTSGTASTQLGTYYGLSGSLTIGRR